MVYDNTALVNTVGDAQWSEGDAFTGVQSYVYWSSTEIDSDLAWYGNMTNGNTYFNLKVNHYCVWPVRNNN